MSGENNRDRPDVVDNKIISGVNGNAVPGINSSVVLSGVSVQPMMLIQADVYKNLISENERLSKENVELRRNLSNQIDRHSIEIQQLNAKNDNLVQESKSLDEKITLLQEHNQKLLKENEKLKNDIIQLNMEKTTDMQKQIQTLQSDVKDIRNDKIEHDNMMTTAETIILYEKCIIKKIFGRDPNWKEGINLHNIIKGKVKLTQERQKILDECLQHMGLDLDQLHGLLHKFKADRNHESHAKYRDPNKTIKQLKKIGKSSIIYRKNSEEQVELLTKFNYIMNDLESWLGDRPFKT